MATCALPAAPALATTPADGLDVQRKRKVETMQLKPNSIEVIESDVQWRQNLRGDASYVSGTHGERPEWWWTGKPPVLGCPGVAADGTMTSLPLPNLATVTRQQALNYFDNTWTLTEVLFSALQGEEAYYRPPYHNLRHPMVFYYGHPAALYINKMRVAGIVSEPVNAYFERIFETGVDEMSWDDLSKNDMLWPALSEVTEYRRQVYSIVRRAIETHPDFDTLPIGWDSQSWALFMGFEHERIHLETSSVLMRELPLRLLRRPPQWPAPHASAAAPLPAAERTRVPENPLVHVPAGDAVLGKAADWPSYGWDNEYGCRTFRVHAFSASRCLVSNGEMLEFVRDGGYRERRWWSADGWRWRTFRNAKWPAFWVPDGPAGVHQYQLRGVFEAQPLPLALPAVVNKHEAAAFCAWRSEREGLTGHAALRLLTEPEHHRLRHVGARDGEGRAAEDAVMEASGAQMRGLRNSNLAYGGECAVDAMAANEAGFHDVFGNVWQWCEDKIAALPASRGVHLYYDDFTTPCYDGEHQVILGGSFVSTGDEASAFARFHFRPHFHQHAGFRVVSGTAPMQTSCADSPGPHVGAWDPSTSSTSAEAASARGAALATALLSSYGAPADALDAAGAIPAEWAAFPARAVALLTRAAARLGIEFEAALDVGCGVGGASFALAARCGSVLGVDADGGALAAAAALREQGSMLVDRKEEGEVCASVRVEAPGDAAQRQRCSFKQMDPCCLAPDLPEYDAVVMLNVLERIVSPKAPLGRLAGHKGLLRRGGLLLLASTYEWSSGVADPQLWLGGQAGPDGRSKSSAEALKALLSPSFELVEEAELPLVARTSARAFSLRLAHTTVWRRTL